MIKFVEFSEFLVVVTFHGNHSIAKKWINSSKFYNSEWLDPIKEIDASETPSTFRTFVQSSFSRIIRLPRNYWIRRIIKIPGDWGPIQEICTTEIYSNFRATLVSSFIRTTQLLGNSKIHRNWQVLSSRARSTKNLDYKKKINQDQREICTVEIYFYRRLCNHPSSEQLNYWEIVKFIRNWRVLSSQVRSTKNLDYKKKINQDQREI